MPWVALAFGTVLVIVMATIIGTSIKHAHNDWETFHIAGDRKRLDRWIKYAWLTFIAVAVAIVGAWRY